MPSPLVEKFCASKARGGKIAALTAYDYPTARLLDESGLDVILVGDSLGMVVLGYPDTTHVTMDDIVHHTRAVARGVKNALVVSDLPFGSYETSAQAVENSVRLIDAGAKAVKLEGGVSHTRQIEAITANGIPVMAHIGMLPQSVQAFGGYKIQGATAVQSTALLEDARAVEQAGAFAIVMELVEPSAAKKITDSISIPTIGIGSGDDCDGQILVTHDLIGLFPWFKPKFVSPKAEVAQVIRTIATDFVNDVKSGRTPGKH